MTEFLGETFINWYWSFTFFHFSINQFELEILKRTLFKFHPVFPSCIHKFHVSLIPLSTCYCFHENCLNFSILKTTFWMSYVTFSEVFSQEIPLLNTLHTHLCIQLLHIIQKMQSLRSFFNRFLTVISLNSEISIWQSSSALKTN